jgi:hypothetical protein
MSVSRRAKQKPRYLQKIPHGTLDPDLFFSLDPEIYMPRRVIHGAGTIVPAAHQLLVLSLWKKKTSELGKKKVLLGQLTVLPLGDLLKRLYIFSSVLGAKVS